MSLDTIPLDRLSEEHLQRLVVDHEQEGKTIEFKSEPPGSGHEEHEKFLAAITSFANTVGGDLIYGVQAPNGVAEKVLGLNGDLEAAMSRLENLIRTAVQPRVTAYNLRLIPVSNGNKVLVFRISRVPTAQGFDSKSLSDIHLSTAEIDSPPSASYFCCSC